MRLPNLLIAAVSCTLLSGRVHAGHTIAWGNEVGSVNVASDGSSGWDVSYVVALGTFGGSFVPSGENTSLWTSNWRELGRASYNTADGYFSGATDLGDNSEFQPGEQAYIWIYSSQSSDAGSQWLLLTDDGTDGNSLDNWVIPYVPTDQQQSLTPLQWEVNCSVGDGTLVIFGGMREPDPMEPVQAAGEYVPPSAAWSLQTHTFAAIPEPGLELFLSAAAVVCWFQRRRPAVAG